jgi:hypothetical protein
MYIVEIVTIFILSIAYYVCIRKKKRDNKYILLMILVILIGSISLRYTRSIESFTSSSNIDKKIYCFWTGTNEMSTDRKACLDNLREVAGYKIVLVTPDNMNRYILPDHPLHEAFQYLSETHKADYLRTYFMHFYGGGYSDIKKTPSSWKKAFKDIENNSRMYINGCRERGPEDIAAPGLEKHYSKLVANCAYIVRPNTPFTKKWYSSMMTLLDSKLDELRLHPATYPQDKREDGNGYPIEWNEMLGRIFHRILMEYLPNIGYTLPYPITVNYR